MLYHLIKWCDIIYVIGSMKIRSIKILVQNNGSLIQTPRQFVTKLQPFTKLGIGVELGGQPCLLFGVFARTSVLNLPTSYSARVTFVLVQCS